MWKTECYGGTLTTCLCNVPLLSLLFLLSTAIVAFYDASFTLANATLCLANVMEVRRHSIAEYDRGENWPSYHIRLFSSRRLNGKVRAHDALL